MTLFKKYLIFGLGHGVNDSIAGYILGSLCYQGYAPFELGLYILLYNLLAFGGQILFAVVFEQHFYPKHYWISSFVLLIIALLLFQQSISISILCAGMASAAIHVIGGTVLAQTPRPALSIGIFAGPGVIGLIGGGFLAYLKTDYGLLAIFLSILCILSCWRWYQPDPQSQMIPAIQNPKLEKHDLIMCALITIICLRSFVWDVIQLIEYQHYSVLMLIAIAAMLGKIIGGYLADKFGYAKYTLYALSLALPFLTVLKKNIWALSIGVVLLQSTIPSTTMLLIGMGRQRIALGIAMSFGLAVLIPIILIHLPMIRHFNDTFMIGIALLGSILLLYWCHWLLKKRLNIT